MFEPLASAIAAQYEAFQAPRPRVVEGCSCCTTADELRRMTERPREALAAGALDRYAAKAMTTIGTSNDFRYYWPRLVELKTADQLLTCTEILFGKPRYGQHHTWPSQERAAMRRLGTALGEWIGAEELEFDQVDSWVCAIGLLMENLTDPRPLLEPLLADSSAAWANLRLFVESNEEAVQRERRLSNSFWENAPQNAARVREWYETEPRVREAARALAQELAELYGTSPPAG
jgi:hypothetical protein